VVTFYDSILAFTAYAAVAVLVVIIAFVQNTQVRKYVGEEITKMRIFIQRFYKT
jgi:hypothetical protein